MNADIAKGMAAQEAIAKYASELTGDKRKDKYYLKRMNRTTADKLAKELNMSSARDISKMMSDANQKIACPTWIIPSPYSMPEETANRSQPIYSPEPTQATQQQQKQEKKEQQTEFVNASEKTDTICPRYCLKPRVFNE